MYWQSTPHSSKSLILDSIICEDRTINGESCSQRISKTPSASSPSASKPLKLSGELRSTLLVRISHSNLIFSRFPGCCHKFSRDKGPYSIHFTVITSTSTNLYTKPLTDAGETIDREAPYRQWNETLLSYIQKRDETRWIRITGVRKKKNTSLFNRNPEDTQNSQAWAKAAAARKQALTADEQACCTSRTPHGPARDSHRRSCCHHKWWRTWKNAAQPRVCAGCGNHSRGPFTAAAAAAACARPWAGKRNTRKRSAPHSRPSSRPPSRPSSLPHEEALLPPSAQLPMP
jgi:hypothetical protein